MKISLNKAMRQFLNFLSSFLYYIKLLLKKWFFWFMFVLEIIGIIISLLLSSLIIPTFVYWIIAFIGFLWSGFQVFQDISKKLPNPELTITVLDIALIEGTEYSFTLGKDRLSNPLVPSALLDLNLRLSNPGPSKFEILSIYGEGVNIKEPFIVYFNTADAKDNDDLLLTFPFTMNVGDIFFCKVSIDIQPTVLTNAQVAARIRKLYSSQNSEINVPVRVEIMGQDSKINTFNQESKVSLRPLFDLYLQLWTANNALDLVRLANETIPNDA